MQTWTLTHQWQSTDEVVVLPERRRETRSEPFDEGTHLWLDDSRRILVRVIDESPGGIGVVVPDTSFAIGPRLCVDFEGTRRFASVAYLSRHTDGDYRLGLEWIK